MKKLKARKAEAVAKMQALIKTAETENRDMTADEIKEFDALQTEVNSLDQQISRAAFVEKHNADLDKPEPAAAAGYNPSATSNAAPGPHAKTEFESFGEFMFAVTMRPGDSRLASLWKDNVSGPRGEQRMDTGTSGGFMVPKQFISTLRQVDAQGAIIRPRATVIEAGDPPDAAISMPALDQGANIHGGVQVQWTGEGGAKQETSGKFKEIVLTPHEISGFVTITDKLLRNWQASASVLQTLFAGAITSAEEKAFAVGDGVAKPLGALKGAAAIFLNRATANTVKFADIANMMGRVRPLNANAVWMINQSVLPQLINMQDGAGRLIWVSGDVTKGIPATLMGYPVLINDFSPALGTKGDISLSNFSNYLIKDGSGPYILSDGGIVNFTSNKTLIKAVWNVDGAPWMNAPILGEDGITYSPFIGLDVPAG